MVVDHDPARHRGQPRHEGGLAEIESAGLTPGPDHRLLNDVLSLLPISRRQPHYERHQRTTVLLIQRRDDRVVFGWAAGACALRFAGPQPPSEEAHKHIEPPGPPKCVPSAPAPAPRQTRRPATPKDPQ